MEEIRIEDMTDEEWADFLNEVIENEEQVKKINFGNILFGGNNGR